MNADADTLNRPESFPRVILCRLFSLAAILSIWHIPDWTAAVIYAVGIAVYYIPYPAASPWPVPSWLRLVWVGAVIVFLDLLLPSLAPAGSIVPPVYKYGMLALLAVQIAADLYRRNRIVAGERSADAQPPSKSNGKPFLLLGILLLIAAGLYVYFFGGPFRFVDIPLAGESMEHLRSGAGSDASWSTSPSETAIEYLDWWPQLDRMNRSKLRISTSYRSTDEAVVTIIDDDTQDDSVSRTCDRLTLRRPSGVWLPVRHQQAWQGRGRSGWTTEPAS